ncbi:hypothetical protein [Hymenobacter sp. BRD67]|uniref:hypothetical protein n=1 Tax=Hymenobacter sp. BRD67 TaxID=2675877 RepID=UPI00293BACAA|nr:hypothetical protein [Hymenobacter sp. BRD67]
MGGQRHPAELAKVDVKGKAVAMQFGGEVTPGLSFRRYQMATMRDRSAELMKAGAVAVVIVGDARAQAVFDHWAIPTSAGATTCPAAPTCASTAARLPSGCRPAPPAGRSSPASSLWPIFSSKALPTPR